jgi:RNA 3'-terminal phosphate cyclase (ATP)
MIEIDGSEGEGGGQILRTSLTLSLVTGRPVALAQIRAGRRPPGLRPQHLASVRAAAEIGRASVEGDQVGSRCLTFRPGGVVPGRYRFAIGTAGSASLVLQTIHLPLALARPGAPSDVAITGGTHVSSSPSFEFLDVAWSAWMARLGAPLHLGLVRPGFYPRGGGEIVARIPGSAELAALPGLPALPAHAARPEAFPERPLAASGRLPDLGAGGGAGRVTGRAVVAGLPAGIASRMRARVLSRLATSGIACELAVDVVPPPAGPGAYVVLVDAGAVAPAVFTGLGERGKRAERVADEALDALLAHRGGGALAAGAAVVEEHAADQIVLPLALAPGRSRLAVRSVSRHLLTNLAVIRRFVARAVRCTAQPGEPGTVELDEPAPVRPAPGDP